MGSFSAGGNLSVSQQFPADQTDIFSVDLNGQLNVFWVEGGGLWHGPQLIGPPNLCVPGAPIAASRQFGLNQTDVFIVDVTGRLQVFYVSGAGVWQGPEAIGTPKMLPSGSSLAVSQQLGLNQTDVFFVDQNGQLNICWVDDAGAWQGPAPLGPQGLAPSGCSVAASQQFGLTQTDVFLVGNNGQLYVFWVDGAGAWNGPLPIGPPGIAKPGSHLATCKQSSLTQADVFLIDNSGQLVVFWVAAGGPWNGPLPIGAGGLAVPGSPVTAVTPPGSNLTSVFVVDTQGQLNVFSVVGGNAWLAPRIISGNAPPGAFLTTCTQFGLAQTDLFWVDATGNINVLGGNGWASWAGPQILSLPASWPINKPILNALDEVFTNADVCASLYLDTTQDMARGTGYGGDHAQGLARTHKLLDGSIVFFLAYSKIGGHGSISTYRYAGPTDGDHVSEQELQADPLAVAPQTQLMMVSDEHPADIVFLPEVNGADAGYLFVTEPRDSRTIVVFRWDAASGLQSVQTPAGLFAFTDIFANTNGPNFIFLDRVGSSYFLGVAGFDKNQFGLLFSAQGDELFPPTAAGEIVLSAFQPVAQSEIAQEISGQAGNLFFFPVDQDACQVKLAQDSIGQFFLLGFREDPPSETEGTDFVDVYPVTFSPFSIAARSASVHIQFRPGDTGFSSTGTHFVDQRGRIMLSSSYRWSEDELSGGAGYVSRVDECCSL